MPIMFHHLRSLQVISRHRVEAKGNGRYRTVFIDTVFLVWQDGIIHNTDLNFHRLIIDDGLLMLERKFQLLVPLKERLPKLGG